MGARARVRRALPALAPLWLGCTPMVDVGGVYFPGWLVSAVSGVVVSYGVVAWLGRSARASALADSGLFFLGLIAVVALGTWWVLFSGF